MNEQDSDDPIHELSNPHRLLNGREVALALRASTGSISKAAEALNVPLAKLSRYIHARPKFQELLKELRTAIVDVAESHFIDKVHEGDWKAVHLALTTLGKDRGFGAKDLNINVNKTTDPTKLSDAELAVEVAKRVQQIKSKQNVEKLEVKQEKVPEND